MSADTAGIWMPAPAERIAIVRKISHTRRSRVIMMSASARVETAIAASAPMIS